MNIKNPKGVAAIEFAILLPVLMLILSGAIEFGLAFYNKQVVTNASREGARAGIVAATTEGFIKNIVKNYCKDRLITFDKSSNADLPESLSDGSDSITVTGLGGGFQSDLTVNVKYEYEFLFFDKIIKLLFSSNKEWSKLTLSAQTVMKIE
jgi:Flp pilus assembly protein TadG